MKLKTITITIIAAIVLMGFYMYLSKSHVQKGQNELVVGTTAGYAPFVSINPQGEYEGFDIDFAKALAQKMGKKLVIKDLGSMSPLFMALDQSSIDAIIWALSITQSRLQKVEMIHYQGENVTSYPLIFWKEIPANIKSLNDLQNLTVCVEPASAQSEVLNKYKNINILPTEKVDDALLNIQYGKAIAALVEPAIAQKFKNKYPEIKILDIPLDPDNQVYGTGIAIKKDNIKLIDQIKTAVAELKQEGKIKELEKKWNIT